MFKTIVLATTNPGKVVEMKQLLRHLPYEWIALDEALNRQKKQMEPIVEDGLSFVQNAIIKAEQTYQAIKMPLLAEDSGLCIQALGGQPGIYSARFAMQFSKQSDYTEVNEFILSKMRHYTSLDERKAYYQCSLVFMPNAFEKWIFSKRLWGEIAFEASGREGFGYDPIFCIPEQNCTMAQMSLDEKNKISHRARAIKTFCNALSTL